MGQRVDFVVGDARSCAITVDGHDAVDDLYAVDDPGAGGRRGRIGARGPLSFVLAGLVLGGTGLGLHSLTAHQPSRSGVDHAADRAVAPSEAAPSQAVAGVPLAATGCPVHTSCVTVTDLPDPVLAAVQARFPAGAPGYASSTLARRNDAHAVAVRQRTAVFDAPRYKLVVQIGPSHADDTPVHTSATLLARTVVHTTADGRYVTVQAQATRAADLPRYEPLQQLVADPRLLVA